MAIAYLTSMARGSWYRFRYGILGSRVHIGRNLRVRKTLRIRGPGRVIIGDNAVIDGTSHDVTPYTYHPSAVIRIGNNVFLNGTRFGCRERIEIGDDCIIGDASMLDTDFHHIDPAKRHGNEPPPSAPIVVGNNVWIAGASIIVKGVRIGDNSVVGAGSVVVSDIPANSLAVGNPAKVIRHLQAEQGK